MSESLEKQTLSLKEEVQPVKDGPYKFNYKELNTKQESKLSWEPLYEGAIPKLGDVWRDTIIHKLRISLDKKDMDFIGFVKEKFLEALANMDTINLTKSRRDSTSTILDYRNNMIDIKIEYGIGIKVQTQYIANCSKEKLDLIHKYFYFIESINLDVTWIKSQKGPDFLSIKAIALGNSY